MAGWRDRPGAAQQVARRADRHRRLADDEALPREVRRERLGGAVHVAEVGRGLARLLRRADAEEVNVAELTDLLERSSKAQPSRVQVLPQERLKPRLEEGGLPSGSLLDLRHVDVDGQDLVAQIGHADGMGQAQVADADGSDAHV